MHLLIIILQQLLGLLPNGEGKKAPQVELARPPRQKPHGSDPAAFSGAACPGVAYSGSGRCWRDWAPNVWASPMHDWMTMVPVFQQVFAVQQVFAFQQGFRGSTGLLDPIAQRRLPLVHAGLARAWESLMSGWRFACGQSVDFRPVLVRAGAELPPLPNR
jgi:hypothetical protein